MAHMFYDKKVMWTSFINYNEGKIIVPRYSKVLTFYLIDWGSKKFAIPYPFGSSNTAHSIDLVSIQHTAIRPLSKQVSNAQILAYEQEH